MPEFADHPATFAAAMARGLARARCVRVIDGDTVDVLLDHGWHVYSYQRLRILGVDAPELNSSDSGERERAQRARGFVVDRVVEAPLLVRSHKNRKSFDRFLADVYLPSADDRDDQIQFHEPTELGWTSLSDLLVGNELGARSP